MKLLLINIKISWKKAKIWFWFFDKIEIYIFNIIIKYSCKITYVKNE